jgi:hypothetical protein
MAHVFFHYLTADGALVDRRGTSVANLAEARDRATGFVRALVATPSAEDWRHWILHVSDEQGEELFNVPFARVLGRSH